MGNNGRRSIAAAGWARWGLGWRYWGHIFWWTDTRCTEKKHLEGKSESDEWWWPNEVVWKGCDLEEVSGAYCAFRVLWRKLYASVIRTVDTESFWVQKKMTQILYCKHITLLGGNTHIVELLRKRRIWGWLYPLFFHEGGSCFSQVVGVRKADSLKLLLKKLSG